MRTPRLRLHAVGGPARAAQTDGTAGSQAVPGWATGLRIILSYLTWMAAANFAWEIVQLPLYTIWWTGTGAEIAFAVLHCTGGDVVIAAWTLALAGVALRPWRRQPWHAAALGVSVALLGISYTAFSEWLNVTVRGAWAYAEAMPILPPLGTGLSPVLQWLILPPVCLRLARRRQPPR